MAKSFFHFQEVKDNSREHNLRKCELNYVFKEYSHLNASKFTKYGSENSHLKIIEDLKSIVKEKTGRSAQKKSIQLQEGLFLFNKNHTNEDVGKVVIDFKAKFGVEVIEYHIHRDEGYIDKKTGKFNPNLHCHFVFENIDRKTGKSHRFSKEKLVEFQTYFAEALSMERGITSNREHLNCLEFVSKVRTQEYEDYKQKLEPTHKNNVRLAELDLYSSLLISLHNEKKLNIHALKLNIANSNNDNLKAKYEKLKEKQRILEQVEAAEKKIERLAAKKGRKI